MDQKEGSQFKSEEEEQAALEFEQEVISKQPEEQVKQVEGNESNTVEKKEIKDIQEKNKEALEVLEEKGFFEKKENNIVVNLSKFKEVFARDLHKTFQKKGISRRKLGIKGIKGYEGLEEKRPYKPPNTKELFYHIFKNKKVISQEDWQKGVRENKPLFYMPETSADAFNQDKIIETDFYLGFWELRGDGKALSKTNFYPSSKEELNFNEVSLACLVFNKNYGDARRNRNTNKWIVKEEIRNPNSKRVSLSANWFEGKYQPSGIDRSPRSFIAENCPNLVEKKLLLPEDFRMMSTSLTGSENRVVKSVNKNGMIMIDGVRYMISKKLVGSSVYKVSNNLAVITKKDEEGRIKPAEMFELKPGLKPKEWEEHPRLRQDEVGIKKFSPREFFLKRPDESDLEYKLRLRDLTDNFILGLNLGRELAKEGKFFMYDFSMKELYSLAFVAKKLKERGEEDYLEKLQDFTRRFGHEGLKAFCSVEYGEENGNAILRMEEKLEEGELKQIFSLYSEIIRRAQALADEIEETKKEEVFEAMMRRAKELMISASFIEESDFTISDIIEAMQMYSAFLNSYLNKERISVGVKDIQSLYKKAKKSGKEDLMAIFSTYLEAGWKDQIKNSKIKDLAGYTAKFYEQYTLMNKEAASQNADTLMEISRLNQFFKAKGIKGKVLDAGCGDGERITEPMAKDNPELQIVGLDLIEVDNKGKKASYIQGDMRKMSFKNEEFEAIMSNWSSVADLLGRRDQVEAVKEFSRILKKGGYLYLDLPYLEKGDYKKMADSYHKNHKDEPYGTIELYFNQKGKILSKKCFIYPYHEIEALLGSAGFEITNPPKEDSVEEPLENSYWITSNGKSRLSIIAQKTGKSSSDIVSKLRV